MRNILNVVLCGGLLLSVFSSPIHAQSASKDSLSAVFNEQHKAVDFELLRDRERLKVLFYMRDGIIMVTAGVLAASAPPLAAVALVVGAAALVYADVNGMKIKLAFNDKETLQKIYAFDSLMNAGATCLSALFLSIPNAIGGRVMLLGAGAGVLFALNPFGAADKVVDEVIKTFGMTIVPNKKSAEL